ncbi:MAG: hypothetical protein CM15mV83_520 [uncultured marine virus]|nr:MAG: hypothetical protein CM15mV83_520 [uncultured marine virus]
MSGGGGVQRTVTELNPTQEPFVEYGLQEAKNLYQTQDTPQFFQTIHLLAQVNKRKQV